MFVQKIKYSKLVFQKTIQHRAYQCTAILCMTIERVYMVTSILDNDVQLYMELHYNRTHRNSSVQHTCIATGAAKVNLITSSRLAQCCATLCLEITF